MLRRTCVEHKNVVPGHIISPGLTRKWIQKILETMYMLQGRRGGEAEVAYPAPPKIRTLSPRTQQAVCECRAGGHFPLGWTRVHCHVSVHA